MPSSVHGAPVPISARIPAAQGHNSTETPAGETTDRTVSSHHSLHLLEALQDTISFESSKVLCLKVPLYFTLDGRALRGRSSSRAAALLMLSLVHTQLLT